MSHDVDFYTPAEAAEILRISRSGMYRVIQKKQIRVFRPTDGRTLITPEAIAEFIAARTVDAAAD